MFISQSIVAAAKAKGEKMLASTARPGEPLTQVDEVVDLLAESTSPAAQPGARKLLVQMGETSWAVIRGAHRSDKDPTLHVTIVIKNRRYHLRLDARMCVFDITYWVDGEPHRPARRDPWVGPGN